MLTITIYDMTHGLITPKRASLWRNANRIKASQARKPKLEAFKAGPSFAAWCDAITVYVSTDPREPTSITPATIHCRNTLAFNPPYCHTCQRGHNGACWRDVNDEGPIGE